MTRMRVVNARALPAGRPWFSRLIVLLLAGLHGLALIWPHASLAQQPLPALTARVTDQTQTLSPAERQQLDSQLADIEQRKGAQVVVVVVASTLPEPIEDYSIRLAEAWKVGRGKVQGKTVDDGVILLVAKNDRKVRIEVGYGLEGAIPDVLAKRIIVESITPRFREGHYFLGLQAAVKDIGRLIEGESLPQPWREAQRGSTADASQFDWVEVLMLVLFGGAIATMILGRFLGSLLAGLGAGFLVGSAGMGLPVAAAAGLAAFIGLVLLMPGRRGLNRVGRHTYRPGGVVFPGGGWSGGSGGGSGGGFSGGGGGFGGGGASGDW